MESRPEQTGATAFLAEIKTKKHHTLLTVSHVDIRPRPGEGNTPCCIMPCRAMHSEISNQPLNKSQEEITP